MKNNKKIMALVVAGILSGPVMANEESADNSQTKKSSVSVIDVNKVKRDSIRHDQLSTEVALLKLELERAQLTQQIAESNAAVQELSNQSASEEEKDKLRAEFQALQDEKEKLIEGLQARIKQLETNKVVEEKKELELDPLDKVFVVGVRGVGNNLTAQFYIDNDIVRARKGQMIGNNIFVENITVNGALIRSETASKFSAVTTIDQAYHKSKKLPQLNQEKFEKENKRR